MSAADARVLVVGDANPDLVLRGDVVPRFGQAEQLLDDADSRARRVGRDRRVGVRPAGPAGVAGRRARQGRLRRADQPPARRGRRRGRHMVHRADVADRADRRPVARRRPRDPHPARRDPDADRGRGGPGDRVHCRNCDTSTSRRCSCSRRWPMASPRCSPAARARGVTTSLDTNDDPSGAWAGVDALLAAGRRVAAEPARGACARRWRRPAARPRCAGCARTAGRGQGRCAGRVRRRRRPANCSRSPASPVRSSIPPARATRSTPRFSMPGSVIIRSAECVRRAVAAGAFAVGALGGTAGQPTPGRGSAMTIDQHTYVAQEIRRQPDAWARAVAPGRRPRRSAAPRRRARRGYRLWHLVVHGAGLRRHCAKSSGWARRTPSPPASSRRSGPTTGSSPSHGPAPRPRSSRAIEATKSPVVAITALPDGPVAPPPTTSCCSTSPTSDRSCRPCSRRPR